MQPQTQRLIFWAFLFLLVLIIIILDRKYGLLRDASLATKKPYSFARTQLAWWTAIVLASFITIMITKGAIPTFDSSTLVLLGISMATTGAARAIDVSEQANPAIVRNQNNNGENFFLDILSDGNGVNIQRLQTVIFNLVFGVWFISAVLHNLIECPPVVCADFTKCIDCDSTIKLAYNYIIPKICDNNLILLGLSAGTYAVLKTTENKSSNGTTPFTVKDESGSKSQTPAQG